MALTGKISVSVSLTQTITSGESSASHRVSYSKSRSLTNGVGADQGDLMWHDQRTLTNGATESLDLHGGTLTGAFGAVTFDKVKGVVFYNHSTTDHLKIGGAAANAAALFKATTDILVLPAASTTDKPAAFVLQYPSSAGVDVTTNDEIKIAHGADTTNPLIYDVVIWGED
jgi:hypothetical protein